ncbi:hypothetical protein KC351_g1876 [Hortaea werneckii]|nr:hypothetical protein KC351_g1876 [Hortaea werneckii]
MSEQLTKHDRKIFAIWKAHSKSQWDDIAAAGGYPHRKAGQKAVRRVIKKLALPDPPTGGPNPPAPTPQPRRKSQTTRPKKGSLRSNAPTGRPSTSKKGGGTRLGSGRAGEGKAQDTVEGVGQGMDQGSDRFVVGRPYNEKVDRDFRQSHRDALRTNYSSQDEDEEEHDNDDDDDDEMEW